MNRFIDRIRSFQIINEIQGRDGSMRLQAEPNKRNPTITKRNVPQNAPNGSVIYIKNKDLRIHVDHLQLR